MRITLCVCLICATVVSAQEPSDAATILNRAIASHGGKEKLATLKCHYLKRRAKFFDSNVTTESWIQYPAKSKDVTSVHRLGQARSLVAVQNGDTVWEKVDGLPTHAVDKDEVLFCKEGMYRGEVLHFYPLVEERNKFVLSTLNRERIDGRWNDRVHVASMGHEDIDLYFDSESSLLTACQHRSIKPGATGKMTELLFSNYQDFHGVKLGKNVRIKLDGVVMWEEELVDFRPMKDFPMETFAQP